LNLEYKTGCQFPKIGLNEIGFHKHTDIWFVMKILRNVGKIIMNTKTSTNFFFQKNINIPINILNNIYFFEKRVINFKTALQNPRKFSLQKFVTQKRCYHKRFFESRVGIVKIFESHIIVKRSVVSKKQTYMKSTYVGISFQKIGRKSVNRIFYAVCRHG